MMKMISVDFTVLFRNLKLTMQGSPAPAKLQLSSTLAETVVTEVPHSQEGEWPTPYGLTFEATLGDVLKAPDLEHVKIQVLDSGDTPQGEALLAFRDWFTARADTSPLAFK